MKIYVFLKALILALTGTASGQTQYTYWVDSSCLAPARAVKFFKAFDEAIVMAHNAAVELINHDPLQLRYFKMLFSPSGQPGDFQYEELLRVVAGVLGHSVAGLGVSNLARVYDYDRDKANYRFYCDNDRLDGGSQRWRLVRDPPLSSRPLDYIPQEQRPFVLNAQPLQAWQEWEDPSNGIRMAMSGGCHNQNAVGATYHAYMQRPWMPGIRATVTICDLAFDGPYVATVLDLASRYDFSKVTPTVRDGVMIYPPQAFQALLPFHILRELLHLPPWLIADQPSSTQGPTSPTAFAFQWLEIVALSPDQKVNNVNNFVYIAFLTRLKELGFQLARDDFRALLGYFDRL